MVSKPCDPSDRIPSLDGLRAISCLFVVADHYIGAWGRQTGHHVSYFIIHLGSLGVSVFFGISGYLITSLLLRERERTRRTDLAAFYVRRAFRILPAFLLFYAFVIASRGTFDPSRHLAPLLFVADYAPGVDPWLGHTWSLSIEEQFYLLWPLVFALVSARGRLWFAVSMIAAAPLVRVACLVALHQDSGLPFTFHGRLDAIMVGCAIALLRAEAPRHPVLETLRMPVVAAASAFFLLVLNTGFTMLFKAWYRFPLGYTVEAIAVASVLLWSIAHHHSPVGRLLNLRPVAHVGAISYGVYLWQQPFYQPEFLGRPGANPWIGALLVFLAAELSYWLLERPMLRLRAWLQARDLRAISTIG